MSSLSNLLRVSASALLCAVLFGDTPQVATAQLYTPNAFTCANNLVTAGDFSDPNAFTIFGTDTSISGNSLSLGAVGSLGGAQQQFATGVIVAGQIYDIYFNIRNIGDFPLSTSDRFQLYFDGILVADLSQVAGNLCVGHYYYTVTALTSAPAISFQADGEDNPSYIYVDYVSVSPHGSCAVIPASCSGAATGDPQFSGFMGQNFQVHGASSNIYNVISSPNFQYNALFSYLDSGKARKGTAAFSHPGNYFGAVGVLIKDQSSVHQVQIDAGPVDIGLQLVINNATVSVGSVNVLGPYTITLPSTFVVVLESDEFALRIQNSDMFLNQDVSIGAKLMKNIAEYKAAVKTGAANAEELKAKLPHGILGQTWNLVTYNNRWKYIEGQLFDYQVDQGLMGTEFKYNRF